ncbi:hypothetical protein E4U21_002805 [Claviceps maximensis]|nr:hypothetical protein E4U21_002805 [Claviceps maximensis]
MPSGSNDPKLLYAINGIKAYHIAQGNERALNPFGPQTLSLLMVPTSSGFADASGFETGEEDFYLHLHLPPELDLPLPATTQIYHQPPTSYLIPRWDLGPDSGAFTRIEFPAVGTRDGVREDVDTFETILAQCTAFLERAQPPGPKKGKMAPVAASSAKARSDPADTGEALPPYDPGTFTKGEAYVQGSMSSSPKGASSKGASTRKTSKEAPGGRIVLVNEEDGSVVGELGDAYQVVEDKAIKPGSKDPVEIALPTDSSQAIKVQPAPGYNDDDDDDEDRIHPAYKKSTIVNMGMRASRLLITTSDYVAQTLTSQAENYTKNSQPAAKPVTFTPTTHEHIRKINQYSTKAAGLSASTVGSIAKVAQNLGANLSKRKDGRARGFDKDGNVIDTYKPGMLNKSLMAFSTVVDGMEQAGRSLLTSTTSSVSHVVEHKWGPEAGEVSRHLGGGVKNVGLVYIDVTGVSRRAVLKSVAKGMVVGNVKGGGKVIVGDGGDNNEQGGSAAAGGRKDVGNGRKGETPHDARVDGANIAHGEKQRNGKNAAIDGTRRQNGS